MISIPRTARYVIWIKANSRRCQKHERTSTYTAVREFPVSFLNTKKLYDTRNSTTWCSWSISHDVICIRRTARYVVPNKAETGDAESTSEHQRVQQYAIFRFNSWRRNDMYTTNCQVCDTNWSKQQKMPKARANINVHSSARFRSGLIFEYEKTAVVQYHDDTRNCMVCGTKSDRPPCFVLRKGPSMPRRNWSIRREEPSIAITADLRPFVTHAGLTVNTALLTRHPWRVPASISMQKVNWRTRRPLFFFYHFSNYSSTRTYVVVVLFVVNQRSKLHT